MRQVFQYLAFVALGCAALLSSCQRPEIPEPETLPSQLKVNFSIGFEASDTKATKTAWENGDVVFIFFNGITTNGSGAAKYLKLTWNSSNSSWTSTPMNGLTPSDLAASPAKALTAVYLPFSGNATVNYNSIEGFTFDPSPSSLFWHSLPTGYILEASATDVNTTVLSLLNVEEHLAMTLPDGFIQFFLDDANATASAAGDYFLKVSGVTATGLAGVSSAGGISLSAMGLGCRLLSMTNRTRLPARARGIFSAEFSTRIYGGKMHPVEWFVKPAAGNT